MLIDRKELRVTTGVHSAKEREIKGGTVTEKKREVKAYHKFVALETAVLGGKNEERRALLVSSSYCWAMGIQHLVHDFNY